MAKPEVKKDTEPKVNKKKEKEKDLSAIVKILLKLITGNKDLLNAHETSLKDILGGDDKKVKVELLKERLRAINRLKSFMDLGLVTLSKEEKELVKQKEPEIMNALFDLGVSPLEFIKDPEEQKARERKEEVERKRTQAEARDNQVMSRIYEIIKADPQLKEKLKTSEPELYQRFMDWEAAGHPTGDFNPILNNPELLAQLVAQQGGSTEEGLMMTDYMMRQLADKVREFEKIQDKEGKKGLDDRVNSALLHWLTEPSNQFASSIPNGLLSALIAGNYKEYKPLYEAVQRFSQLDSKTVNQALESVEDMAGLIKNLKLESQHMDTMFHHRYQIEVKLKGGEVLKGGIAFADVWDEIMQKFDIGFISNDFKERAATKKDIIAKLLKARLGLDPAQEIESINLFLLAPKVPGTDDEDKETGVKRPIYSDMSSYYKVEEQHLKTYDDLEKTLQGLLRTTEGAMSIFGVSLLLDPRFESYVPYQLRKVLNAEAYAEKYSIGLAVMRKYLTGMYRTPFGEALAKMHPLLIKDSNFVYKLLDGDLADLYGKNKGEVVEIFNIKQGNPELLDKRKEQLDWLLRSFSLRDEYKLAEDILAGTCRDRNGKLITTFINPITRERHDLSTIQAKLEFMMKYKDDKSGEMADATLAGDKLDGLEAVYGKTEIARIWQGVDFTNAIKLGMFRQGKSKEEIEAFITNPRNQLQGVEGLRIVLGLTGFNFLMFSHENIDTTEFSKWFYYLNSLSKNINPMMDILNKCNASILEFSSGREIREAVAEAAVDYGKQLKEVSGAMGHFDNETNYDFIESWVKGLVEATVPNKALVTRHKIKIEGDNTYGFTHRTIKESDMTQDEKEDLRHLGMRITKKGNILIGSHAILESDNVAGEKESGTAREMFASRSITREYFEEMIQGFVDANVLTESAARKLIKEYKHYFKRGTDYKLKEWAVDELIKSGGSLLAASKSLLNYIFGDLVK
ncbi:hypothetical protein GYA19_04855 [Candidatus Beckwithbacteria bacterium]|nr:hypothetical protein [Candidatus Beckwithbacteria bacterium]